MNDICNVSEFLFTILYADDTSAILNGKHLLNLLNTINTELKILTIWLNANKLSLNVKSHYYILFHRTRIKIPDIPIEIRMNNNLLKQTSCIKYLGVFIDSKLSWIQHINYRYVKNKVSKCVGIMYKARRYLDKKSLVNLYHSFVYPYLIYCIEVWGNASQCHLQQLYLVQKKIIRIITFSDYNMSTTLLFKALNILPIDKLVYNRIGIMMFKYENGLLPGVMNDLYITNSDLHSHDTRQKHLLHINKGSINIYIY